MTYQGPSAKVSVLWPLEVEDSDQCAPRQSQYAARMAILHFGQEQRLTIVAERILQKVKDALTPAHSGQTVVQTYAARNTSEVNHLKLIAAEIPRTFV